MLIDLRLYHVSAHLSSVNAGSLSAYLCCTEQHSAQLETAAQPYPSAGLCTVVLVVCICHI